MGKGDRLAAGGIKADFATTTKKISDKVWADAFNDFNPEEFYNRHAGGTTTGDAGANTRKTDPGKPKT